MPSSKQQELKQKPATNLSIQQQQRWRQQQQLRQINILQDQLNKREFKPGTKKLKQKSTLTQIQPQQSLTTTFLKAQQSQRQSDQQSQQSQQQQTKNATVSSNNKLKIVSKSGEPSQLYYIIRKQETQTENLKNKAPNSRNRTSFVKDYKNIKSIFIGDSYTAHIMKDPHPNIITLSYTGMNLKYLPETVEDLKIDSKKNTKTTKLFYTKKQNQRLWSSYLIKTNTKTDVKKDLFRHLIGNENLESIGLWLGNAHFQYVFYHDLISNSISFNIIDGKITINPQQFMNQYKSFRDGFIAQAINNYASYIQLISKVFNGNIFIIKLNHSPVVRPRNMYMALQEENKNNPYIESMDLLSFKERKLIVKKFNLGLSRKLRELNLRNIYILSLDDIIHTGTRQYIKKKFRHKLEGGELNKLERHIVDNDKSDIWKRITQILLNIQIQYDLQRTNKFPIKSRKSNNSNRSRKSNNSNKLEKQTQSSTKQTQSISKGPNNSNSRGSNSKGPNNSNSRGSNSRGPNNSNSRGSNSRGPNNSNTRGSNSRGPTSKLYTTLSEFLLNGGKLPPLPPQPERSNIPPPPSPLRPKYPRRAKQNNKNGGTTEK